MADIVHNLRMHASMDDVLRAVTEEELLRPWWSMDAPLDVETLAVDAGPGVVWRCVSGPPQWAGTDIEFYLVRDGDDTVVRFVHRNWRESSDAFARCTTKWGRVLQALKSRVETPEADDVDIV